jgi:hypothetical protein
VDGDIMTREAGQKKPPLFERGQLLKASQLNALAAAVSNIILRGAQLFRPPNLQVVLNQDLFAAEDAFTDPSTAEATVLIRNRFGNLQPTGRTETVVNRFENISIDKDTYIKIEWIDGEWQPYAGDCAPFSESLSQGASGSVEPSLSPPGGGGL